MIVDARLTRVSGHAERLPALEIIEAVANRPVAMTVVADKGYDAADFVEELRTLNVHPEDRRPALGDRPAHHAPCRLRDQPARPQAH